MMRSSDTSRPLHYHDLLQHVLDPAQTRLAHRTRVRVDVFLNAQSARRGPAFHSQLPSQPSHVPAGYAAAWLAPLAQSYEHGVAPQTLALGWKALLRPGY